MLDQGNYEATITGLALVDKSETEKGGTGLSLQMNHTVSFNDNSEEHIRSFQTIVSKDGVVQLRTMQNIAKWATGWDGKNPYDLVEMFQQGKLPEYVNLNVVVEVDNVTGRPRARVAWVNPSGYAGGNSELPESTSKEVFNKKWLGVFQRETGAGAAPPPPAQKSQTQAPPPPPPPPAQSSKPPPMSRGTNAQRAETRKASMSAKLTRTSEQIMQDAWLVWEAWAKTHVDAGQVGDKWWDMLANMFQINPNDTTNVPVEKWLGVEEYVKGLQNLADDEALPF